MSLKRYKMKIKIKTRKKNRKENKQINTRRKLKLKVRTEIKTSESERNLRQINGTESKTIIQIGNLINILEL